MDTISIVSQDKCTGCGACYNICPLDAISMSYTIDGFLAPTIDEQKCSSCGKCVSACPVCNPIFKHDTHPDCYAAMALDEELRIKSSSGGIFSLFAEEIFKEGGIVSGAAYNNDFLVEHIIIDTPDDLDKLRGSKYLQSDTKKVYKEIKAQLDAGQHALFCGCPCQVGALTTFLGKDYPNLLTIDLMCHGGPAPLLFKKYLTESYAGRELKQFSFRDKSIFGWSTEANAYFKDGTSEHIKRTQDDFYRAFLPCLSVRKSCGTCIFSVLPRQGDITLADFWGARKYKQEFDDGKGTSIVILNSKKGKEYYTLIASKLKINEAVPLDYILKLGQPLDKPFKNHPEHDRFFEIVRHNTVKKAFHYIKNRKFDVGVIGVWPGLNYGSVLTYYALQHVLKEMGLSPLMIDKPGMPKNDIELLNTHSRRFAKDHFYISRSYALKDLHVLNRHCDSFIIGSDQVWNYGISKNFGKAFYLDFVHDDKKKISYASSFGHVVDFASPAERVTISRLMQRFDAISVREDSGVQLCKDIYGVTATQVLDPVFLIDPSYYHELAERSTRKEEDPYLLAYILDVTPEKKELMLHMSRKLGLKLLVLLDGFSDKAEKNRALLDLDEHVRMHIEVYDWLYYFKNASYVLTDSFHGMSYSILFNKQFLPVTNKKRGHARFASLARLLNFESRLVTNPSDAMHNDNYMERLNFDPIKNVLADERRRCRNWLHEALFSPKYITTMSSYPIIDNRSTNQKMYTTDTTMNDKTQIKQDTTPSNTHEEYVKLADYNKFLKKYQTKQAFLDVIKFSLYNNHERMTLEDKINWCAKELYRFSKYFPNIKNPSTFCEWINYYKLFYRDPLMTYCVDKYYFKQYVTDKIGSKYICKLIDAVEDVNDIDFSKLPHDYIIKSNMSSGAHNLLKITKKITNIDQLKSIISKWKNPWNNLYYHTFDWAYKDIKPLILIEELFKDKNKEIKVFCWGGGNQNFAMLI